MGSIGKPHHTSNKLKQKGKGFEPENFIPGLVIGFILGLFLDLSKPIQRRIGCKNSNLLLEKNNNILPSQENNNSHDELKMINCKACMNEIDFVDRVDFVTVLIVRQDLRMGAGKIASQCAHAATGMYSELLQCRRSLLRQWEIGGQPKIVLTCKNQQEMNRLKEAADSVGLPTYVVADAGRTQVSAGSKTVLAIGPGSKASIDSVTGRLRLL